MPYVSVEELFPFLFPFQVPEEGRWPFVIMAGYYDESLEKPGFAVAGYVAPYDTWVHLDWAWQDFKRDWKIDYFKASECENLLGQFAQYRDDPKDVKKPLKQHEWAIVKEVKTRSIDIITKHADALNGSGAAIVLEDYEKLIREDEKARHYLMENPYYIALQLSLIAVTVSAATVNDKEKIKENHIRIKPIFDSHKDYSDLAKLVYDKFIEKNPRSAKVLLPLDYEDDVQVSALQIADTLAYETRKYLSDKILKPEKEMRTALKRLLPTIHRLYRLDYQQLKTVVAKQKADWIAIEPIISPKNMVGSQHDANAKVKTPQ